jgi:putative membrane protein
MRAAANVLVAFVALQHLGFLVLEMFLWDTPVGHRVFGLDPTFAEQSASLAANQGLYNGFLFAGLAWGLVRGEDGLGFRVFFLSCVCVAGVFGAVTASASIFWIQASPALAALLFLVLSKQRFAGADPGPGRE